MSDVFSSLFAVWQEMYDAILEILPKAFMFVLWVLCGIIILPCVYIAGNLYPKWVEWGEEF